MKLAALKLEPGFRTPYDEERQREGWFIRREFLEVGGAEVLFTQKAGQVAFFASSGSQPERVNATKCRACLYGMREFDLRMDWEDLLFAGGTVGAASLWARARWMASGRGFPLDPLLSDGTFTEQLSRRLESALAPVLESILEGFAYEPLCNPALGEHLAQHRDALQQTLQQQCGLLLPGALRVDAVSAPSVDGRVRQDEMRRMQEDQRRREAQDAISRISMGAAVDQAAHAAYLQKQQCLLKEERIALETARQREEVRAAIELVQEQARQKKRLLRAEADLMEAEAEAARKRIRAMDEELAQMNASVRQIADTICTRTDALERQIANLEAALLQVQSKEETSLALVADWRAHGTSGILIPRLGANAKLPTGILLDVAVTVNRDAYVYVLLQDSAGDWISLIPELPDMPVMGVKRPNRQCAGEVVVWPDANTLYPDSPPQWQLQPPTGFERLIVLASETEIEVARIFRENGVQGLLERAKPVSRSIGNPGKTGTALSQTAQDYGQVMTVLRGVGSVCQETVIEHLSV